MSAVILCPKKRRSLVAALRRRRRRSPAETDGQTSMSFTSFILVKSLEIFLNILPDITATLLRLFLSKSDEASTDQIKVKCVMVSFRERSES